jgi:ArsR family metal-binding transcriptional regulator
MTLIECYRVDVFTPPCSPGSVRFAAIVHLETDLRDTLPYLNSAMPDARYNPSAPALNWHAGDHEIVFGSDQIAIGNLADRAEAESIARDMVDLVNRTWAERAALTPDHTAHQRAAPMQVYALLPRTNCRACGQATCFQFALQLIAGQAALADCPSLAEPAYSDQRARLMTLNRAR